MAFPTSTPSGNVSYNNDADNGCCVFLLYTLPLTNTTGSGFSFSNNLTRTISLSPKPFKPLLIYAYSPPASSVKNASQSSVLIGATRFCGSLHFCQVLSNLLVIQISLSPWPPGR